MGEKKKLIQPSDVSKPCEQVQRTPLSHRGGFCSACPRRLGPELPFQRPHELGDALPAGTPGRNPRAPATLPTPFPFPFPPTTPRPPFHPPPSACALRPPAARVANCGGWLCLTADAGSGDPTGPRAAAVAPTPHPAPRLALDGVSPAAGAGTGVALGEAPTAAAKQTCPNILVKPGVEARKLPAGGLGKGRIALHGHGPPVLGVAGGNGERGR